ncbi:MAG: rhamnulokinase [Caldilineaceae bacterium]|nr:rhamnulokinase [Caldilineaceae bacterium]
MKKLSVLAIDLGAESGRVMAVHYDGHGLELEEMHRFPNVTVNLNGTLHWDFLRLWTDIQQGIGLGKAHSPASLGVDTWGVDFGLLDSQGKLLGNPITYRDSRTDGVMERAFGRVSRAEIFAQTGIQFMPINTLYQMIALVESGSPQLAAAQTFLTAPDLLNYWLTGAKVCEFSNATTTQMLNPRTGDWAWELLDAFAIPRHIFPEVVQPGTRLGTFDSIPVIAPACHDTGSAVAATPLASPRSAYISSGTWSLVGLEVGSPVINDASLAANVTNEGGVYGTYRLLKNVMGLWIVQQCRATWAAAGEELSYPELTALAAAAAPDVTAIDPNDGRFLGPGDHPSRVREWCRERGLAVPETKGEIVRSVLQGLANRYASVLAILTDLTGQPADRLHIVGGGSQNRLLNRMTAAATGLPVMAGPVETTVLGNALVQLISLGELADIQQARQLVAQMGGQEEVLPTPPH